MLKKSSRGRSRGRRRHRSRDEQVRGGSPSGKRAAVLLRQVAGWYQQLAVLAELAGESEKARKFGWAAVRLEDEVHRLTGDA